MRKRMTAALLSLALALSPLLSGCGGPPRLQARDLMAEVPAPKVPVDTQMTEDSAAAVMDFCVRLFQEGGVEGENVLISPVSVLYALAMAANGAQGDTLEQMEAVLGLPLLELNEFCRAWLAALPEEDGALSIANSLWFRDSEMLTVEESFLEANALWYGADVYEAPFDDATVSDVNAWVDYHTGGTIPVILEEIPENAMVYLVNALAFDGRWETPYREDQVRAGTFTREDGTVREAELMYSTEDWYLSDGKAQGFLKYYEGGGSHRRCDRRQRRAGRAKEGVSGPVLPVPAPGLRHWPAPLSGRRHRRGVTSPGLCPEPRPGPAGALPQAPPAFFKKRGKNFVRKASALLRGSNIDHQAAGRG